MIELAQLFQDMEAAVVQQEPAIEHIDNKAEDTVVHLDKGNEQLNQAVDKARSARRKKWICLGIVGEIAAPMLSFPSPLLTGSSAHRHHHCCCCHYCGGGYQEKLEYVGARLLSITRHTRPSKRASFSACCHLVTSWVNSHLLWTKVQKKSVLHPTCVGHFSRPHSISLVDASILKTTGVVDIFLQTGVG